MTERVNLNTPLGCSSQTGLLRHAIRAALFSTVLGAGAVPMFAIAAPDSVTTARQSYNIAAGPLSDVLNQFARQAGITLASTPQQTSGVQSPGLHGEYSKIGRASCRERVCQYV